MQSYDIRPYSTSRRGAADDGKRAAARLKLHVRPQGPWGGGLGEGGAGDARYAAMIQSPGTPFSSFLGFKKSSKKRYLKKSTFLVLFAIFRHFWANY